MTPGCASAISVHPRADHATGEVLGSIVERLGAGVDLAMMMVTSAHRDSMVDIAAAVSTVLDPRALIGVTASGVLGEGTGVEDAPGLVIWAARFATPETDAVRAVHLRAVRTESGIAVTGLEGVDLASAGSMVLVADPFSFPTEAFCAQLSREHPELVIIGGLASGAAAPDGNRLVIGGRVVSDGAVAWVLPPSMSPVPVVSQGCRPVGQPWTVTASHANVLVELAGQPALQRFRTELETLSPEDRMLAAGGLHCGLLAAERALDPGRGDFLVRGVLGADEERGTVTVGDVVPVGSVVQLHVRDPESAGEDLAVMLSEASNAMSATGALVFTCNGRGQAMFDRSDHDAMVVADTVDLASAGMMCAGEIGPVAGRTVLHGFTASVALFDTSASR
jgi:small ligand-binding sensory domain FIST